VAHQQRTAYGEGVYGGWWITKYVTPLGWYGVVRQHTAYGKGVLGGCWIVQYAMWYGIAVTYWPMEKATTVGGKLQNILCSRLF
jgi:hypothetical protein